MLKVLPIRSAPEVTGVEDILAAVDEGIRSGAIAPEESLSLIHIYYIAEQRGFDAGSTEEDWAQAELEIDSLLAEGPINH